MRTPPLLIPEAGAILSEMQVFSGIVRSFPAFRMTSSDNSPVNIRPFSARAADLIPDEPAQHDHEKEQYNSDTPSAPMYKRGWGIHLNKLYSVLADAGVVHQRDEDDGDDVQHRHDGISAGVAAQLAGVASASS